MRALVTGARGFAGGHLIRHLLSCGDEVVGIGRDHGASAAVDCPMRHLDLRDAAAVQSAVAELRPDAVYHLAAQSSAGQSLSDPWATIANNLQSQMALLDALVATQSAARILIVGSSDEYGRVRPEEVPTKEDVPLRPTTPYAVSKVGQDVMGYQYFAQYGLPVIRVRPFSHTGPGHDARFAIPSFARQLAEIEASLHEPVIRVGNLNVYRDYTDVRDVARAYRQLLERGVPGEVYNLGRGESVQVAQVLGDRRAMCRVGVDVIVDPKRLRPSDVPRQQADTTKLYELTQWQPAIPWEQTLRDTLDYWRARVATASAVP